MLLFFGAYTIGSVIAVGTCPALTKRYSGTYTGKSHAK